VGPPAASFGPEEIETGVGLRRGRLTVARTLSKLGVCSYREACRWVAAGRVRVDGEPVLWPYRRIAPMRESLTVDGELVSRSPERLVVALNKPVGYITTRVDPGGRPTVYDLLAGLRRWVFPVGRLDRDTAGLLILTNDHELGHGLSLPERGVPKTYHARVRGLPTPAAICALSEGVTLPSGRLTRPAEVRSLGVSRDGSAWIEIVLTEGKNRQLRRMCATVGHDVLALTRVSVGGLALGDLPPGAWRPLTREDVTRLTTVPPR
jgi:23S rRNA pseudouridine2605 synthase